MDFIKMLREDNELSDLMCDVCDMEILPEYRKPEDEFGLTTSQEKHLPEQVPEVSTFYSKTVQ